MAALPRPHATRSDPASVCSAARDSCEHRVSLASRAALRGRMADSTRLNGTVELKELIFAHSRKGNRHVYRPRARGARTDGWRWNDVARDRVLLAVARTGNVHSSPIGGDVAVTHIVRDWALTRLDGQCTVFARMPRAGPCGSPIRAAGHDYQMLRVITERNALSTRHTRNVDAYGRRLLSWLHRFRGVASRYRDNYLLWHRRIDADYDLVWAHVMVVASIPISGDDRVHDGGGQCTDRPP
jgi:hypothetical protein